MTRPRLYSYCLLNDGGLAPNPFWGYCTLAVCKPAIRRTAQVGDWVVGTGSKNSPIGDISDSVIYAMRIDQVLTLAEYDAWAKKYAPRKIPDAMHRLKRRHVGDAVYYAGRNGTLCQRPGVHNAGNCETDIGGRNALISGSEFYYFGGQPERLPPRLRPIANPTQGHRVRLNDEFLEPFLKWISTFEPKRLYGSPALEAAERCAPRKPPACLPTRERASPC